jgi:hypothetical protein
MMLLCLSVLRRRGGVRCRTREGVNEVVPVVRCKEWGLPCHRANAVSPLGAAVCHGLPLQLQERRVTQTREAQSAATAAPPISGRNPEPSEQQTPSGEVNWLIKIKSPAVGCVQAIIAIVTEDNEQETWQNDGQNHVFRDRLRLRKCSTQRIRLPRLWEKGCGE